jgi:ATP-binding cassette subfamily C protein CydCD
VSEDRHVIRSSMQPFAWRLSAGALLGGLSLGAAVGLLATSAWLISMASTHPPILTLEVAIVAVRFFGLSRGILRYSERLISHDAVFRMLTNLRVHIYKRLEELAPTSLPIFRRGELLNRVVNDVETVQDLWLRVVIPWVSALVSASCPAQGCSSLSRRQSDSLSSHGSRDWHRATLLGYHSKLKAG